MKHPLDPLHRALHALDQAKNQTPASSPSLPILEDARRELKSFVEQYEPREQEFNRLLHRIEQACLAIARGEFRSAVVEVSGQSSLDAIASTITMLAEELAAAQAIRARADENERALRSTLALPRI